MTAASPGSVVVLGAGIVGVACALELQRLGRAVTLVDRGVPGGETSFGNAGVVARSSLVPFNHPGLWASLPRLLGNRSVQFRYDPRFLLRNLPWAIGFLARARRGPFEATATALDALIRVSTAEHFRLSSEAGAAARWRRNGWLFLYRSEAGWAGGALGRATFERFGIATEALDAAALRALEPGLAPIFPKALWVKDSASVDSPAAVVQAYAALFAARGGRIERFDVGSLTRRGEDWCAAGGAGRGVVARQAVVALGPWSRDFLRRVGLSVPMAFERGYHRNYAGEGATLHRPVYDSAGGYVLSPMAHGLRLSTGVELAERDAPKNPAQLGRAEAAARQAFALGARLDAEPWLGSRPTLPDSRPVIGAAPRRPGLWLAFGHQHIGFGTGPGTAALLGALMTDRPAPLDPVPFEPRRFVS